ncbi:PH domain-containing protein [Halobacterium salinarum]|uniref:PH domain-containing protein n=1 Tax=Halobacterium salinarum TaxID=2242 RepID=UPI002554781D|nr:PH domain-containing protein [Halobacterium salinarum]MDL0145966.1 PH domain-containing protein [Halobacterium salinarum]
MAIEDYLTDDEELLLKWRGSLDDEGSSAFNQSSSFFGATDKRLLYSNTNGTFKDIEYSHISSIESESEQEIKNIADFDGESLAAGAVGLLISLGGLSIESAPVLGIGVVIVLVATFLNMEDVQKVQVITGDELHSQLNFKSPDNIAADLSRIIREHS